MTHRFSIFKGRRRPVLFVALGVSITLLVGSVIALYLVSQPSAQSPNGRKKQSTFLPRQIPKRSSVASPHSWVLV